MNAPELEAVVLYLDGEGIRHVFPHGRETVRASWDADLDPHEAIVDAVAGLGLSPVMVHSTSWRVAGRALVLTFLVVIEPPETVPPSHEVELVTRTPLARGAATGPPPQVVEHGLRHLAWLVREDEAIHAALGDWPGALAAYEPEPFRAFGREPGS